MLPSTLETKSMSWESCHGQSWKKPLQDLEKPCHSGWERDRATISIATPTLSLLLCTLKLMLMLLKSYHCQNWKTPLQDLEKPCSLELGTRQSHNFNCYPHIIVVALYAETNADVVGVTPLPELEKAIP